MTSMSRRYNRALNLTNARVLITGATSSIGKACAFRFAELKCRLILVGRDEQKLQGLAGELHKEAKSLGHANFKTPELYKVDVFEVEQVTDLARHIGPIDILINNAGCNSGGDCAALMAFVSAIAPMMKAKGQGHIINITSIASDDISPNSSAALASNTVAAQHNLVDTHVRVTAISPGLMKTDLHSEKSGSREEAEAVVEPLGPLYAADVADQIIYVATRPAHVQIADISSYCTHQSHSGAGDVPGVARAGESLGSKSSTERTAGFGNSSSREGSSTPPAPGASGRSSPNVPRLNLAGIEQVRPDSGPKLSGPANCWNHHGMSYHGSMYHGSNYPGPPYHGLNYSGSNYQGPNHRAHDNRSKSPNQQPRQGSHFQSSNHRNNSNGPWGNRGPQPSKDSNMQHSNQPQWPSHHHVHDMRSSSPYYRFVDF